MRKLVQDENKYWKSAINSKYHLHYETARKLKTDLEFNKVEMNEIAENLLNNWYQKNYAKYCEHHNLNKKYLDHRKHFYRNVAAKLVKAGIPIAVEKLKLDKMAEVKDVSNKLSGKARGQRVHAAPYELLSALENAAKREGVPFVKINSAYTSKTCHVCKTVFKELQSNEYWVCLSCSTEHDRDINAAANIACRGYEALQKKKK